MTTARKQRTPAVVAGLELNGLGVVRSLARHDVPVIAVDKNLSMPTARTRMAERVQVEAMEGDGFIEGLLSLADRLHEKPVLFLTQELSVDTAIQHAERLKQKYHIRLPSDQLAQDMLHKATMQAHAERLDVPIPRVLNLKSPEDLEKAAGMQFPCILKPSYKDDAYGARFKKGYHVKTLDEARKLYGEIHPVLNDMVLQEWINGGDDAIYFCLQYRGRGGRKVASFVGRKIRSWPPEVGGTASCTLAPDCHDEIEEITERFLAGLGIEGMASVEFKRDSETGRMVMIEPTVGRTDFQEEVATLNGVNIPYLAYCHEAGMEPRADSRGGQPIIWRDSSVDRWSRELSGTEDPSWCRNHRNMDATWRLNDPMPGLRVLCNKISAKLGR